MTSFLPPTILQLFSPRPPLPFIPVPEKAPMINFTGLANIVDKFEDPNTTKVVPFTPPESYIQRKIRKERTRQEKQEKRVQTEMATWDPNNDQKIKGDPNHTLFVGRLVRSNVNALTIRVTNWQKKNYKRNLINMVPLNVFVSCETCKVVNPKDTVLSNLSTVVIWKVIQRLLFIILGACKYANGKRIDGRRIVADTERGRMQKGWRPRRLGGGLGGESRSKNAPQQQQQQQQSSSHHHSSSSHHHHRDSRDDDNDRDNRYKPYDRSSRGGGFRGGKPGIGFGGGRPPRSFDGDSRNFEDSRPRYEGPPKPPSYDDHDARPRYGYQQQ